MSWSWKHCNLKKSINLDNPLYLVLPWAEDSLRPHSGLLHGLCVKICSTCCLWAAERQPALPWSSGLLCALCLLPSFCSDSGGLQGCFSHISHSSPPAAIVQQFFHFFSLFSHTHNQHCSWQQWVPFGAARAGSGLTQSSGGLYLQRLLLQLPATKILLCKSNTVTKLRLYIISILKQMLFHFT